MPNNPASFIEIVIDGTTVSIPNGSTLVTALLQNKELAFNKLDKNIERAPLCNMGVCYECTVFLKGKGRIRSCMTKAQDGMEVYTDNTYSPSFHDGGHQVNKPSPTHVYDVAIIGAGPTGLGALDELVNNDLKIVIIDEQEQGGGQIYRQPPTEFQLTGTKEKFVKKHLHSSDVNWMLNTVVSGLSPKDRYGQNLTSPEEAELIEINFENRKSIVAKKVVLGLGAYDRMLTIPGWEQPGVMAAGGIQVFVKNQQFVPGEKILLTGTHPFLLIVAQEIIKKGGHVEGIIFSQNFPSITEFLKYSTLGATQYRKVRELISAYITIKKAKAPIKFGLIPTSIDGDQYKKNVHFSRLSSQKNNEAIYQTTIECDILGMCYGFNASTELARQIGCEMDFIYKKGGWIAKYNQIMQSSIPSIFVAGEITGIGGAESAELEGRLAGQGVLSTLNKENTNLLSKLSKQKQKYDSFSNTLTEATSLSKDVLHQLLEMNHTIACKCERVTMSDLKQAIEEVPAISSINALKQYTRCGMGLCQGRYCESTLMAVLEKQHAYKAMPKEKFNTRHPIKPISIQDLISNK
ncbi:2Fe-2S iron-sulfur cluster-binding protein [Virgibacillus halodenitrificans]|uniref:2Fe-2S iron-sulfur cluster-binding protein n=1 Tax=Virgibacillus halodenitrificans TaxID=1482 RepID=UPI0002D613A7|nr:2Fe-2S iron-sulfur cluster-binding protein [Virgibacillus halodenitrificans]